MAGRSLIQMGEAWWSRLMPQHQKLKDRLNLILFAVVFTVCVASLIALQIALRTYDNMLYRESAKVLNLSSMVIENELKKIENISFLIMADSSVQGILSDKSTGKLAERYQTHTRLQQSLNAYAYSEGYIASINLVDSSNNQISVGRGWQEPGPIGLDELIALARKGEGRNVWVVPAEGGRSIMAVRAVRQIQNLSLDYLGLLVIRLNMPELISRLAEFYPRVDTNLIVMTGDGKRVHSRGLDPDWEKDLSRMLKGEPYGLRTFGGRRYFTASTKSSYTGWTYLSILPYDRIYQRILLLRNALMAVFVILFTLALWMGLGFTRSITRPIENLARLIKQVEQGDFSLRVEQALPENSPEEIRHLYRDFEIMLARIDALIQEEYEQQLLLKDTRYRALQAQINPHFLYNTLDSINWMAKAQGQREISAMVLALGDLLRSAIGKDDVLAIREELKIVQNYITIQKIRHEDRLVFETQLDEECLDALVPKLSLQPLVENSINYGLEKMVDTCRIVLRVGAADGMVVITVEDNGPGMDVDVPDRQALGAIRPKGTGIGLKNIDDRLKTLFGPEYGLRVTCQPGRGTQVSMFVPAGSGVPRKNTGA